ncbi:hypothetical protein RJ639_016797 [Escallonia herrerae]|uniref:Uncharacterized protein n=1 Tax=Escallonia herrerae TaxID=1293975 RepID=A0AA89ALI1_9ASTE|nr:hypothetical protein RJ639_016797 [Escallonia herrerae]
MVDTKTDKDSVRSNFVYIVANFLEQEGVNLKDLDNFMSGVDIIGSNVNQALLSDGKKLVYWSSDMGLDLVQKRLKDLGDDDEHRKEQLGTELRRLYWLSR